MGNSTLPRLVTKPRPLSLLSAVCFYAKTHKRFKPACTGKSSLELTLSVQTPEAHGAGHMSMDMMGKQAGCSVHGPELAGRSQHCAAPSRQKHRTLLSSLPWAVLTAPLTQPPSPHRLPRGAQPELHVKPCKKLPWCIWLCALPGLGAPEQLRLPGTAALRVSCEKGRGRG